MDTPPPSGRRRGARKGDTREADLLRTFEALIATKSPAAIGIDELALGAGISRSAFYFYFASKDAVLTALLADLEESLLVENADWYDGGPAEPALRRSVEHGVRLWSARGPLLRLIYQSDDVPEPVREFRTRSRDRARRMTAERIERERAAGLAPAGPPSPIGLATALIQLRTQMLSEAFAPPLNPAGPTAPVDAAALVDDLVGIMMRLLYGEVRATSGAGSGPERRESEQTVGANP